MWFPSGRRRPHAGLVGVFGADGGSWEGKSSLQPTSFFLEPLNLKRWLISSLKRLQLWPSWSLHVIHLNHFSRSLFWEGGFISSSHFVVLICMLAAFSANRSPRRRDCQIATIQGTMLPGVATPGRQRGVVRWNPANRRAVPDDFRSVDLWQSGWRSVTAHFSVKAERHRPRRDRHTEEWDGWKTAEMRVNDVDKERCAGVFRWGQAKS